MSKLYIDGTDLSTNVQWIYTGGNGFGLPQVNRYTQQGPLQDGATDIGFSIGARTIVLTLLLNAQNETEYNQLRRTITRLFKPRIKPLKIQYNNLVIEGHYVKGLELDSNNRGGFTHKISVALQCANPFWYNPTQQVFVYNIGAAIGNFSFPITFPVSFGASTIDQNKVINYVGDWITYPTITINGPIDNLLIENTTTGDKLDFPSLTLAQDEAITIDTNYGYKTVSKQDGTNVLPYLSDDSDLATFSLTDENSGINNIHVYGANANANTEIYIRYHENFIAN